jgi:DNA/RNA endonuclease YhcR with UshA esterase domain
MKMRVTTIQLSLLVLIAAVCSMNRADTVRAGATTQAAATQPTTAPVVVQWEEAARHVGQTVTITGPVKGTHVTGGGKALILNVGKDYPDAKRFTVMITTDEKNPAKAEDYVDKTVTVTGKVELYRNVAEIKVAKAADVTVAKE